MPTDESRFTIPRSVRVEASYGAVPWACPESVTVEWADYIPEADAVRAVIGTLAHVPEFARPEDGAR